jgi:outer membrane protein
MLSLSWMINEKAVRPHNWNIVVPRMHNNKLLIKLGVIFLSGVFSSGAYSSELQRNNASIPSLIDYTTGDGFVQAVGVKFKYESAYRGSDQYVLEATLDGAAHWRHGHNLFFIENYDLNGVELGWRNFIGATWLIQSGLRHETVLPSSKTKHGDINNFPHRGSQVFGFFEVRRALDVQWRNWATGRFSGGPNDFGLRAEISISHQFFLHAYGSAAEVEVFTTFGDEEQINNYFGISQSDANTSGLAQIDLNGGYRSSGINAMFRKTMFKNIQFTVEARLEYYSNEVQNSSLVRDTSEASMSTSLIYRF